VKEKEGYLIECKCGGFVTRFKEGEKEKLYVDKRLAKPEDQLFRISSKNRFERVTNRDIGQEGNGNTGEIE
jgi:hypothetical protein